MFTITYTQGIAITEVAYTDYIGVNINTDQHLFLHTNENTVWDLIKKFNRLYLIKLNAPHNNNKIVHKNIICIHAQYQQDEALIGKNGVLTIFPKLVTEIWISKTYSSAMIFSVMTAMKKRFTGWYIEIHLYYFKRIYNFVQNKEKILQSLIQKLWKDIKKSSPWNLVWYM